VDTALPPPSFEPPPPQLTYQDRSTGLIVFGIIQIILGALCLLMVPFALLGLALSQKMTGAAMPIGAFFMSIATYGALAALLITLGIGSIYARRWARTITLVLSWIWLISGFLLTIFLTAFLPTGFAQGFRQAAAMNPNAPPPSTGAIAVILTAMIVFLAVFFVALPLAFVLFYRTKNVEETCKHKDPVERWTDRCPLPVLAASLLFASASGYYLLMSFTTPLLPFFGRYLTGVGGAAGCLVLAIVDGFLAYSVFRLQLVGWWIAVVALAIRITSTFMTFRHGNLLEAYSRMGMKDSQLQALSGNPAFRSGMVLYWSVGLMILYFAYLLWIKRYFVPSSVSPASGPETSFLSPSA
jgi:hypothetical protein